MLFSSTFVTLPEVLVFAKPSRLGKCLQLMFLEKPRCIQMCTCPRLCTVLFAKDHVYSTCSQYLTFIIHLCGRVCVSTFVSMTALDIFKEILGHLQLCLWQPNRYYKPKHVVSLKQVVFVAKPNHRMSTVLWKEKKCNWTWRNIKNP